MNNDFKEQLLPWTGERYVPEIEGTIELEHLHRYLLAEKFVHDKTVLDIASGEGYGSNILSAAAKFVIGVDISEEAVNHARLKYRKPNLEFRVGSADNIPVDSNSVDVVVSFETIEHLDKHEEMMTEIKRVLKPGGILIISSPDKYQYSIVPGYTNPYHVKELLKEEFEELLSKYFKNVCFLGQRVVYGSLIVPEGGSEFLFQNITPDNDEIGLSRPIYDIAVASDEKLPVMVGGLFEKTVYGQDVAGLINYLSSCEQALAEREEQIASLNRAVAERDQQIANLNQAVAERDEKVAALDMALAERDQQIASLNQAVADRDNQIASLNQTIQAIYRSRSWWVTAPVRFITRNIRKFLQPKPRWGIVSQLIAGLLTLPATFYFYKNIGEWLDAVKKGKSFFASVLDQPSVSFNRLRTVPRIIRLIILAPLLIAWLIRNNGGVLPALYEMYKVVRRDGANSARWWFMRLYYELYLVRPQDSPQVIGTPLNMDRKDAFKILFDEQAIYFHYVDEPKVSIIIPVYRGLSDLLNCLCSLVTSIKTEPPFEVILVDDCPEDPVLCAIPDSGGLVKLANEKNLGFLLSCNRGATVARGQYLCFLNSDTIVLRGWLRSLLEAVEETPGAAIAGGMILNPDGSIQDAGWCILRDGWGYPIGRGGNPRNGAYTYRRKVDCVTGACFFVSKKIFQELGGFDPLYAPAFYEEFDFAFRARMNGIKVVYEPRCRIVHLGSVSYGIEKRDQLSTRNHAKFVKRFSDILRKQPLDTSDEFKLREFDNKPVLLVVDISVPHPDRHAGDVTMSSYLRLFAEAGWHVIFAPFDGQADDSVAEDFEKQGIELIRSPWTIEGWLAENGRHVDYVWLSRPDIAESLIGTVKAHTFARIVYYTHDLHHLRLEREAKIQGNDAKLLAEAKRVFQQEYRVFSQVDHIMSPSVSESEVIKNLVLDKPVTTILPYFYEPNEITARDETHFAECSDVVFIGGFPHKPNVDAVLFMVREVMPIVWQSIPEVRLVVVGYAPPPEIRALEGPRIVVTGQVPDVKPFLNRARVFLAPMRFGAGVKGKIIQALQHGVPVVTTPIGIEGTGIKPGQEALVAEDAQSLAEAVISLFCDLKLCASLSFAGAKLIRERYSRTAARDLIEKIFEVPRCSICGSTELFQQPLEDNFRESFVCANCYALARSEAVARVILKRFAIGGETLLTELMCRGVSLRIHEFGFSGAIATTLRGWDNFSVSEYYDDIPPGAVGPHGVRCEDLHNLTFPDNSFDLVITQDVLEHVSDPLRALEEIFRVLKPGGVHVFTVPRDNDKPYSTRRALIELGKIKHLLPPVYHGDPVREKALVFTDFGMDLVELVKSVGFQFLEHQVRPLGRNDSQTITVFEAVKPVE